MTKPFQHRVGLLTLPLTDNFGSLLQIIALYTAVEQSGFKPFLINKVNLRSPFKTLVANLLERLPGQNVLGIRKRKLAAYRHQAFLLEKMPERSRKVSNGREISKELSRLLISGVMVGSDQVWRFEYQGDGREMNYFLDFGPPDLVRLAYAASFGHSDWKYHDHTNKVGRLLARFDMISVREATAVDICRNTFGRPDVSQALDPTLLHDASFYYPMLERADRSAGILIYVLDHIKESREIARQIGPNVSQMSPFSGEEISVPQWLGRIADAEFVITDSFHGTVFSIIFNKPFLTIVNTERGSDRFFTLLNALGLQDRLIYDIKDFEYQSSMSCIDYEVVNSKLSELRAASRSTLHKTLEKISVRIKSE